MPNTAMTLPSPDDHLFARLIEPQSLSLDEQNAWADMRASNPALYSPYFHIGYTQLIASLRADVSVMVVENDAGDPVGFLPLQGRNFARPLGDPFTDYHGMIARPDTDFDLPALLKQAGIGAFYFDSFVGRAQSHIVDPAPRDCAAFDIKEGGQSFRSGQGSSYTRHLKGLRRRARKSESLGAMRVEWASQDKDIFAKLLAWKRAQYERSGKYDVLGADWTRAALTALLKSQGDLRADMHALYFGETLAAIDLGLTDGKTYHSWITAYDPKFSEYSPGMQLLERMIDEGTDLGYSRIDLGPGLEGYKKYYSGAQDCAQVECGFTAGRGAPATLAKLYGAAERVSGTSGLPGKMRRRYTQIAACDPSFSGRIKGLIQAASPPSKP